MNEIIIAIIVVVVLLLILASLFLFTVRRVNVLVKKVFVDKLQEYDFLIEDREKKIEELNENIEIKKNDKNNIIVGKIKEYNDIPCSPNNLVKMILFNNPNALIIKLVINNTIVFFKILFLKFIYFIFNLYVCNK